MCNWNGTWINNGDFLCSLLSSLPTSNYDTYDLTQHCGRPLSMRGGGFFIIKHNFISLTPIKVESFSFFECISSVITSLHSAFKLFVICIVYHRLPFPHFFTEFKSLLKCHISPNIDLFFLGDINIKIDNINDY